MLTTDNTDRYCSRCRLPLTDVASRECGVGPVCRQKDTHLYAKTIPANYAVAQALVMGIPADGEGWLHAQAQETWTAFYKAFNRLASAACQSTDGDTFSVQGQDLRKVITQLDFMCSWSHPNRKTRDILITVVDKLGYVGLAGVLSGTASTSKSRLWFENGRVHMTGLNNRSGWTAMGQIPGIVRPSRFRKDPYSAPAAQAEAFVNVVRRFWPLYEGSAPELLLEAAQWVASCPAAAQAAQASTEAVSRFTASIRSEDFTVSFPWVRGANMNALIARFKSIPAGERSYNPQTRKWAFRSAHLETVLNIARESRIFGVVDSVQTTDPTPSGVYLSHSNRTQGARVAGRNSTWFSAGRRNPLYARFR